ncbi:MAG: hypothetical protein IH830_05395 [Planctomycetes bacterium]|nr:hypothetical protein [Planctomycetota bacterium]
MSRKLRPGFSFSSATARRQYEKRNPQVGETGDERFTQTEALWLPARHDRGLADLDGDGTVGVLDRLSY